MTKSKHQNQSERLLLTALYLRNNPCWDKATSLVPQPQSHTRPSFSLRSLETTDTLGNRLWNPISLKNNCILSHTVKLLLSNIRWFANTRVTFVFQSNYPFITHSTSFQLYLFLMKSDSSTNEIMVKKTYESIAICTFVNYKSDKLYLIELVFKICALFRWFLGNSIPRPKFRSSNETPIICYCLVKFWPLATRYRFFQHSFCYITISILILKTVCIYQINWNKMNS